MTMPSTITTSFCVGYKSPLPSLSALAKLILQFLSYKLHLFYLRIVIAMVTKTLDPVSPFKHVALLSLS